MSILKVRNENGDFEDIPALVGPTGAAGPRGPAGPQGPAGPKGDTGEGLTIKGRYNTAEALETAVPSPAVGDNYYVGTAAPYEVYTYTGTDGWLNGGSLQGAKGDTGPAGPQGAVGPQGEPGEQGPAGPTGPAGSKGEPGAAATVSVGTVTTGAAGSGATVLNTGTTSAAVLNFTIPRGDKGETGPRGETGSKGETGPQGAPGPNELSESTATALTGLLKGDGTKVTTAAAGTDYATPEQLEGKLDKTGGTISGMLTVESSLRMPNIPAYSLLRTTGTGVVQTASSDTDYATPGYVTGQVRTHDQSVNSHADLFNAKLSRSGGTMTGALDITSDGNLKFSNPNMQGMMLKTNVDGVVCEATAGTDYEQVTLGGTATNRYAKFAGGLLICWHSKSVALDYNDFTALNGVYFSVDIGGWTYPAAFVETPSVSCRPSMSYCIAGCPTEVTATGIGRSFIYSANAYAGTYNVFYIAVGRWK